MLLPLYCALAVGCGGASQPSAGSVSGAQRHAAARVCSDVRAVTVSRLGAGARLRITDSDPTNIECVLRGRGMRVDVNSQPSAVAYTEFDTTSSHYSQVFGNGAVHNAKDQPIPVDGLGGAAIWVAAQDQLVATNAEPGQGGVYVTVTVKGGHAPEAARIALARVAGRATLASTRGR